MNGSRVARAILLCVACVSLCSMRLRAQKSPDPPECPLTPSQSQLLRHLSHQDDHQPPRIVIDSLAFDGPVHVPDSLRQELISTLEQKRFFEPEDWRREVEYIVSSSWEDKGYITMTVEPNFQFIGGDETQQHYSVSIRVDEGPEFRMGEINISYSKPEQATMSFSLEMLRAQVPLQRGDLFSTEKVRQGLMAMKRLFGTRGYVDFTATPQTDVDHAHQIVNLALEVDPGVQYKLRKLEIVGTNPAVENQLRSVLKPGDAPDAEALVDFVRQNAPGLPPEVRQRRLLFERLPESGSVDVHIDLRPCPAPED